MLTQAEIALATIPVTAPMRSEPERQAHQRPTETKIAAAVHVETADLR